MKKFYIVLCSVCAVILSLGLTACGSKYAKVTGIMAGVGTEQIHPLVYGNPLLNEKTLIEDDYLLQVGQDYILGVTYTQSGGSIVCSINTDSIVLKYDAEVLEITPPEEKEGMDVYYNLTCRKSIDYTAVIIEVDNTYSYIVIISAK